MKIWSIAFCLTCLFACGIPKERLEKRSQHLIVGNWRWDSTFLNNTKCEKCLSFFYVFNEDSVKLVDTNFNLLLSMKYQILGDSVIFVNLHPVTKKAVSKQGKILSLDSNTLSIQTNQSEIIFFSKYPQEVQIIRDLESKYKKAPRDTVSFEDVFKR